MSAFTLFDAGLWFGAGLALGAGAMWAVIATTAGALKWVGRSIKNRCMRWEITAFFWDREMDEREDKK